MNETAQSALSKISMALKNLKVSPDVAPQVKNWAHNLVLTVLRDEQVQKRLQSEPDKLIEELSKL